MKTFKVSKKEVYDVEYTVVAETFEEAKAKVTDAEGEQCSMFYYDDLCNVLREEPNIDLIKEG
jgi:hypothetical protein